MKENVFDTEIIRRLYKHRWAMNYGDTAKKETEEFWNERAKDFAVKAYSEKARAETNRFLDQFDWSSDETVLDVAAGPGTFAIPLAKKVAHITAFDISQAMLDLLAKQANTQNVKNISIVCDRWLEMSNIEPHDTVLCLNSLGVISTDVNHEPQLEKALQKLAASCKKRLILLIPHADSPLEPELRIRLGLEEVALERRRVAVIYLAMVENGMLPSLNIIKRPFHWIFKNLNEAVETLFAKSGVEPTNRHADIMRDYLKPRLKKNQDGNLGLAYEVSQALYVWNKAS
jgi:SAM-dependent methyltransferase